jgi:CBS domain-containing protein
MIELKVRDIMTKDIVTIDLKQNAMEAAKLMKEKKIASLVVTKGKTPFGIVTERDFVRLLCAENLQSKYTNLTDVVSSPLITVGPNISVEDAAKVMAKNKIRRLVIVDDANIVGIVTATDLAGSLAKRERVTKSVLLALTRNMEDIRNRYIFGT